MLKLLTNKKEIPIRTSLAVPSILMATFVFVPGQLPIQSAPPAPVAISLDRTYKPGEYLQYEMTGSNRGWEYQIQANDWVKQDEEGTFYEEIGWSNLRSNAPMTLSPSSLSFRQVLSLAPTSKYLAIPLLLSTVQPFLIGPITDMLTFYSDIFLARKMKLTQVGQHAYFEYGKPNSWADGQRVLLGQDSVDFDLTLLSSNAQDHTAVLLIRHVPPKHPQMELPAPWMQTPIGDAANNWVQVEKSTNGYTAQVGYEVFDVRITLDTFRGKIRSAQLHNPVVAISRECSDAALYECSAPTPEKILRDVTLRSFW
jgi:hypothetical protein